MHRTQSFPLLALCLANNTRNRAELLENSRTKTAVINSSLAYAFNCCTNKHGIQSPKNQTALDLGCKQKKERRNPNRPKEINHYLVEEKNNIPRKEFTALDAKVLLELPWGQSGSVWGCFSCSVLVQQSAALVLLHCTEWLV